VGTDFDACRANDRRIPAASRETAQHSISRVALQLTKKLGGRRGAQGEAVTAGVILKRASASRPSGQWSEDDYDVIADDAVVGRILRSAAKPPDRQWMWTLAYGYHKDRTPTHGYEPTREAAMAAFAKSWRRE
jgi:hypothetical protein